MKNKIKVKHNNRWKINYDVRNFYDLVNKGWPKEFQFFKKDNKFYVLKTEWEEERKKQGLPTFSLLNFEDSWFNLIKAKSHKALIRKLRKNILIPNGTKFRTWGNNEYWGVEFTVKNNLSDEEIKNQIYSNIKPSKAYSTLSDNDNFNKIVNILRDNGYLVKVEYQKEGYWFAYFNCFGVRGGFCTENDVSYSYINNKLSADNSECFDKWSKCPFTVPLYICAAQPDNLIKELEYLASPEGYYKSSNFEDYPYQFIKLNENNLR